MLELVHVLAGEMPLAEWSSAGEGPDEGELHWWREGVFVYRRTASVHGAVPGETSATGVTILHLRLGGSEDPAGPAFPEPVVVDVPFPE
jgi:hypothetical protein